MWPNIETLLHSTVKLTCDKWEHAASTALADHDFPRDFPTINLKALTGKNPNDAVR